MSNFAKLNENERHPELRERILFSYKQFIHNHQIIVSKVSLSKLQANLSLL